jgi:hypothetical protein
MCQTKVGSPTPNDKVSLAIRATAAARRLHYATRKREEVDMSKVSFKKAGVIGMLCVAISTSACGGQVSSEPASQGTFDSGASPRLPPSCANTGCTPEVVLSNVSATALAVDEDSIYLADPKTASIVKVPIDSLQDTSTFATGLTNVKAMAFGPNGLYVAQKSPNPGQPDGSVMVVPREGGAPQAVLSSIEWPSGIAVAGTDLIVSDFFSVDMSRITSDGRPVGRFHTESFNISGVAVWQDSLLWTEENTPERVLRAPASSSGEVTILSQAYDQHPSGIIVDGDFAYWANLGPIDFSGGEGSIAMLSLRDGTLTTLTMAVAPLSPAANSRALYWLEQEAAGFSTEPLPMKVMKIDR